MGGAYFLLLSSLGLAMIVQAQDCTRPVGNNMSLRDEYILLTEFLNGGTVAFSCNPGYERTGGSPKITCVDGNWSSLAMICRRKSCGTVEDPDNGVVNYDEGNEFGDKATVTCNKGYQLIGDRELICGAQGWMNRVPICDVMKCDPPSKILNGMFHPVKESYDYSEVIKYTCTQDYILSGSDVLSCSDVGKFAPSPPTCIRVECSEPDIKNAQWKAGSRPPYTYKSSVTYECEKGFTMKGNDTIKCDINSQWSPGLPQCTRIEVTTKRTPTTTTTTTTTTAPKDRGPDTAHPSDTPDGTDGANNTAKNVGIGSGIIILLGASGVGGKVVYDKTKKRKQVSSQDKKSTNNGETELSRLKDTADMKDDATEQMNVVP